MLNRASAMRLSYFWLRVYLLPTGGCILTRTYTAMSVASQFQSKPKKPASLKSYLDRIG